MTDSTANPAEMGFGAASLDLPGWKKSIGTVAAILLALIFFGSGAYKLSDPFLWAQVLTDYRVPSSLALPFTIALGIAEALAAVLILVPRFRRWGSLLIGLLLVAFMIYIGANYTTLVGKDCSCFPLVKRTIGPAFFVGDGAMLLMAVLAGVWARQSANLRGALVIAGIVLVFAGVSYGVNSTRQLGLRAPESITVDGKAYSLQQGHIFLFFYDPSCPHCNAAAKRMSTLNWKDTKVIGIPTENPQWAQSFLDDNHLRAGTSTDLQLLRSTFQFVNGPYGVALDRGRQKAVVAPASFEENGEPAATLRKIGFVD